jgi:hypothetical protein
MRFVAALVAGSMLLSTGAFAQASVPTATSSLHGESKRPALARHWRRTELYFGIDGKDGDVAAADARWQAFLDREVTPRFPDGFSVVDAYGQWLPKGGSTPERLRSKVLVVLHPDTAESRRRLDAIRAAWKALTGDVSVLRASTPADVSF